MTEALKAQPTVTIDNDRVLVTEWRFAPGAETDWHRHVFDYVVVPQTSGRLLLRSEDGESEAEVFAGRPYYRGAGVEHNVINVNEHEFVFIEIELKKP